VRNRQIGPDDATEVLARLVERVTYKPGWRFSLEEVSRGQGCEGLTLMIGATVRNSFADVNVDVLHLMPVPPAAYDEPTWRRWILEQILLVEKHEALEFFRVDGDQAFFPNHDPGKDPYAIIETQTRDEAHAPALPWTGGAPRDQHFFE
jgi:hypothetical protein